jgi:hypothetical protein
VGVGVPSLESVPCRADYLALLCGAALKNHQRSHLQTNFMGIFVQSALTNQWKVPSLLCGAAKSIVDGG